MIFRSDHQARTPRRARPKARGRLPKSRFVTVVAVSALGAATLAACGSSTAGSGPVTLNFYMFPDLSGATATEIKNCDAQSHGKFTISYLLLPAAADDQRLQLVRRLAAHDDTI